VYLLPGKGQGMENLVASSVIVIAAAAHGLRIYHGVILQNLSVALKLLLIMIFIIYALVTATADSWQGMQAADQIDVAGVSIFTFSMTLMWISFSYAGFNAAIYIASEAHQPRRNVPRALVLGTLLTMFLYIILNAIFVLAPAPELIVYKQDIAAIAAQSMGGDRLSGFVRIIICIALFTSVSSMVMLGPRVYAKMADDGLMPGVMKFNGDAPSMAIFIQALLAILVVWISTLRELLSYLGFTLALSTVITVSSLFVVVRRQPEQKSDLPGYPWAPALFIIFTLTFAGLAAKRQPWEMVAAVVTILSGALAYYWFSRGGDPD
ncbi:MAG: amino acid permease, partial [Gammaproteobacteria bacterium]|nr:amino acid permease [Gammaproteobacteria bacterium]